MPKDNFMDRYKTFANTVLSVGKDSVAQDAFSNPIARMGYGTPSVAEGVDYILNRWTNDYWLMITLFRNHWIPRKVVEIPAKDMVKAWPRLNCKLTPDQIADFDRTIKRTLTQKKIKRAITWARLFGGAGALLVIKGHENILDKPLKLDDVNPGSYKGLIVFDRWSGISPVGNQMQDVESPLTFGLPEYYSVHGQNGNEPLFDIHASRILRFTGPDVPTPEHEANQYWGISVLELIMEEMRKRDNASWSILQLLFRAQIMTQVNPELAQMLSGATTGGAALTKFAQIYAQQNELLSNQSMLILGKDGKLESHQYTFGGIADVLDRFEIAVAAAAVPSIPYSKLFGKNSSGLDNSNDADERNYEEAIAQAQHDDLEPQLMQQLYPVICMSEFGDIPDDLDVTWPSIRVLTEEDKSKLAKDGGEAILAPFNAGVTSPQLTLQELKQLGDKTEIMTNITDEMIAEADDKPQPPIEVEQGEARAGTAEFEEGGGSANDEWNEADHVKGSKGNDADASSKGRWITLESGTHVFIRHGTIEKGPKALEGKSFEKADRSKHIEEKSHFSKKLQSDLKNYQGSSYEVINRALREGKFSDKSDEVSANRIQKEFNNSKLNRNVMLYRGYAANSKEEEIRLNNLLNSKEGDEFQVKGFFSTTTEPIVAQSFARGGVISNGGIIFKIRAKKGTPAINIESATGENVEDENEVLLNHGTKYKVINIDKKNRTIEIEIDETLKNAGNDSSLNHFFDEQEGGSKGKDALPDDLAKTLGTFSSSEDTWVKRFVEIMKGLMSK